jgi:DNA-binding beta-propeller fold protein YncE
MTRKELDDVTRLFAATGLAFAALAIAGCAFPAGTPSLGAQPAATLPQQNAKASALLYVSDTETSEVYVYTYPGGKLKQTLAGFTDPGGECADAKGDVFVTNTGAFDVVEYAHGASSPSATLSDPGYFPFGCSVDPTTGNLAVTNFSSASGSGAGNVAIYQRARGKPKKRYSLSTMPSVLLCGYDDKGNLYVDGLTGASATVFAELPKGGKKLREITLDRSIAAPGGVQWDGKYVAVGDEASDTIYRFSIAGEKGVTAGTVPLSGGSTVVQFWIDGSKIVGPNSGSGTADVWKYPAGGAPIKSIGGLYVPLGTVISSGS